MTRKPTVPVWILAALAVAVVVATAGSSLIQQRGALTTQQPAGILQPALKRNVYVFLDRFLDRTNTTTPAEILAKLDAVDAYFSATTQGAWTFNWTLFYPTLGQPWYLVNETYAQAGASSNLTPLAEVILQAYRSGVTYPAPGTYPLVPSALIVHAGDDGAMTGNTTDLWSVTTGPYCSGFQTSPPNVFCLLTAIVAETDPVGIIAHELTHELQRFDESGNPMGITLGHSSGALPAGMVPVDWWDPMYQGLRNPQNNASVPKGTYPSEFMAWNRMSLGLLPLTQVATVGRGQSADVTLHDLEEPTAGIQAIRIPIVDTTAYRSYYVVELRKGISYDAYFPWLDMLYPNRIGMLVYWVNVSQYGQPFQIFLMKAHPTDVNAQQALFGPCSSSCVPAMTMSNATSRVTLTITASSNATFMVHVDNAAGPSPATGGPAASACPSPGCFLGVFEVGAWGLLLNVAFAAAIVVGASALGVRRQRKRARRRRRLAAGVRR